LYKTLVTSALLAADYGVATGDTMPTTAFKIMAVHPGFDPES